MSASALHSKGSEKKTERKGTQEEGHGINNFTTLQEGVAHV